MEQHNQPDNRHSPILSKRSNKRDETTLKKKKKKKLKKERLRVREIERERERERERENIGS